MRGELGVTQPDEERRDGGDQEGKDDGGAGLVVRHLANHDVQPRIHERADSQRRQVEQRQAPPQLSAAVLRARIVAFLAGYPGDELGRPHVALMEASRDAGGWLVEQGAAACSLHPRLLRTILDQVTGTGFLHQGTHT